MWGVDHYGMGMGWGVMLVWLIPLLLIALAIFYGASGRDRGRDSERSARDILDARYASGEIDRDEYLKRRADLSEKG